MSKVIDQPSARHAQTVAGNPKTKNRASGASLKSGPPSATSPSSSWRILALSISAAILLIVAAPVLLSLGRPESAALYAAFAPLCHQAAERSWTALGYPLAVCIRCFGFYCGIFGAFCASATFSRAGLLAALMATLATVALEATQLFAVPPAMRFLSGAWLGLSMASALLEWAAPVRVASPYFSPADGPNT